MSMHPMQDAFDHNTWATLQVIDACLAFRPEQLDASVPGTYGSILDTMRHLVSADANYLSVCSGEDLWIVDEERMGLAEHRAAAESFAPRCSTLLARDP